MKKFVIIVIWLISSMSFYGRLNSDGERIKDMHELINYENTQEVEIVQEQQTQEKIIEKETNESLEKQENITCQTKENETVNIKQTTNEKTDTVKEKQEVKNPNTQDVKLNEIQKSTTEETKENTITKKDNNNIQNCNHTGNWYDTEQKAIAVYEAERAKWEQKWANSEISNEEFKANCPYRL